MRRNILLAIIALFSTVGIFSCDRNDDLVLFSPQNDVTLGAQVHEEIMSKPDEYPILSEAENPEAYKLLGKMLDDVLASDAIVYKDIFAYDSVKIIQDDEVLNAFATPGGYIYVYTGLIKYLDSPDHLAGVLGHEIAHADQRHTSKAIQTQMGIQLLLDVILGENQNAVTQVLQQLGSLKYGRSAETEADEYSVQYLSNNTSPYECTGAAGFFQKLTEEGDGAGVPEFLSTHPNPDNRIQHIQETAQAMNCDTESSGSDILQQLKNALP